MGERERNGDRTPPAFRIPVQQLTGQAGGKGSGWRGLDALWKRLMLIVGILGTGAGGAAVYHTQIAKQSDIGRLETKLDDFAEALKEHAEGDHPLTQYRLGVLESRLDRFERKIDRFLDREGIKLAPSERATVTPPPAPAPSMSDGGLKPFPVPRGSP